MNFKEYRKWWYENKNEEEWKAPKVVGAVLKLHELDRNEVELFPRFVLSKGKTRIEFDLLIKWHDNWKDERFIGIEFKDIDFNKVVYQAVVRREYVDYMYVATLPRVFSHEMTSFFLMIMYGIGWVIQTRNDVAVIFRSEYTYPNDYRIKEIIDSLSMHRIKKVLSNLPEEKLETLEKWLKESKGD